MTVTERRDELLAEMLSGDADRRARAFVEMHRHEGWPGMTVVDDACGGVGMTVVQLAAHLRRRDSATRIKVRGGAVHSPANVRWSARDEIATGPALGAGQ
jgi:hypothetical protein